MSILKTISTRWKAETPKFFKGLQKVAAALGTSAIGVWTADSSLTLQLHPTFLEICKYLIVFSAAMGGTAQLTQVNPDDLKKKDL